MRIFSSTNDPKGTKGVTVRIQFCSRILIGLSLCSIGAVAQTNVTTSGGTTNKVPVFTGSSTIGNSPIAISSGNVGIGTTTPVEPLHIFENVNSLLFVESTTGGAGNTADIDFTTYSGHDTYPSARISAVDDGDYSDSIAFSTKNQGAATNGLSERMRITSTGNVGIGTSAPSWPLTVSGLAWITNAPAGSGIASLNISDSLPGSSSFLTFYNSSAVQYDIEEGGPNVSGGNGKYATENGLFISVDKPLPSNSGYVKPFVVNQYGDVSVGGNPTYSDLSGGAAMVVKQSSGNVGIGTNVPNATLEVNGTAQFDGALVGALVGSANAPVSIGSAGISFGGTAQTTAWTGVLCGGDYAESVNVTGDRINYAPGDVLVIDPASPGKFLKSDEPYSTLVTGVYSTDPGVVGRRQKTPKSADEVPMAMIGIVPTRVSAENGAIHPGDLLVTASTMGYAMKGTDRSRMLGAVIGKALSNLDSGTGVIEAAITLQ
jgi:hypothetical protein